ncbi:MAG: flagellar basal body P-ring formation protein FlgA [Bdellovibrionaceae bacterium]|nr:flagellar basal body P-ring formation protein FlgA [Pseudobdellovibrionaceae bacterium]
MARIILLSFFLSLFCWGQTELSVSADIEISKKNAYTLYDLVVFKQGTSDDLESLKKISVLFLTKKGILEAVKDSGLKTKIVFEDDLKITTTAQVNKLELQRKISNHLTAECNMCIFDIQVHKLPFVNEAVMNFRSTDFDLARGSFMLPLWNSGQTHRAFATGSWKTYKKVAVTNKWLGQGHRLSNGDIKEELKEVTFLNNRLIEVGDLVGRQLARSIPANTIVTRDVLAIEKVVKKGDVVRLLIKDGPFEIEVSALAESDGQEGDSVKVKTNQKTIAAKVLSKDKVVSE